MMQQTPPPSRPPRPSRRVSKSTRTTRTRTRTPRVVGMPSSSSSSLATRRYCGGVGVILPVMLFLVWILGRQKTILDCLTTTKNGGYYDYDCDFPNKTTTTTTTITAGLSSTRSTSMAAAATTTTTIPTKSLEVTPPPPTVAFNVPFIQGRDRGITIICPKLQEEHERYSWIKRGDIRENNPSNLTGIWKECLDHRTGNALSSYYSNRFIAAHAGINFEVDMSRCGERSVLTLLGNPIPLIITNTSTASWQNACLSCVNDSYSMARFPHTCGNHNMTFLVPVLKKEFANLAKKTLISYPDIENEIDDVSIHLRLGDVLGSKVDNMGLLPFPTYLNLVPKDVSSIGIITAPYIDQSPSEMIVIGLQEFLSNHYPNASVSIRNSRSDTTAIVMTRLVKARRLSLCTSSTYCTYPTLGTEGIGVLIPSHLYGKKHPNWIDRLDGVLDIRVPKIRFIPGSALSSKVLSSEISLLDLLTNMTNTRFNFENYTDLNNN